MAGSGTNVVFIDIDGTLVKLGDGDGSSYGGAIAKTPDPSPRVAAAIERLASAGGLPIICTGRPLASLSEAVRALPFGGMVTLSGSHVVLGDRVLAEVTFSDDELEACVDALQAVGIHPLLESTDGSLSLATGGVSRFPGVPVVDGYADLARVVPGRRFAEIAVFDDELDRFRASDYLGNRCRLLDVSGGLHIFVVEGASKPVGIRLILSALGADDVTSYAIGDSENDLAMLELADVAVVMGNASEELKATADLVTSDVDHDGVAVALERLGLI